MAFGSRARKVHPGRETQQGGAGVEGGAREAERELTSSNTSKKQRE